MTQSVAKRGQPKPGYEWQAGWTTVSLGLPKEMADLYDAAVSITGLSRSKLGRVLIGTWLRNVFGKDTTAKHVGESYAAADYLAKQRVKKGIKDFVFNPEYAGKTGALLRAAREVIESPQPADITELRIAVLAVEGKEDPVE